MKVLLVYPNISLKERYPNLIAGLFGGRQLPLGIFCLAAYLRREGHNALALDAEGQDLSLDALVARVGAYDVLGISCTSMAFRHALELAEAARAACPR